VIREGAASGGKQVRAMSVGLTAGGIGTLRGIQGSPENPAALLMELPDRTRVTVSKEKPYATIIGYAADMVCDLPPVNKKNVKVGDIVQVPPENYRVNAVDTNTVVLRDVKSQKQFIKELNSNNPVANLK
jgi:hypothetical protein